MNTNKIHELKKFAVFSMEALPAVLMVIGVLLVGTAIVSLMGADVFTGAVTISHMTQGDTFTAALISLATTGLLIGFMAVLYLAVTRKWVSWQKWILLSVVVFLFAIDFYFDMLAADIIRYGQFITIGALPAGPEQTTHTLFRVLLAGLSTLGETLASAAIVLLPQLNEVFKSFMQSRQPLESPGLHQ